MKKSRYNQRTNERAARNFGVKRVQFPRMLSDNDSKRRRRMLADDPPRRERKQRQLNFRDNDEPVRRRKQHNEN